MDRLSALIAVAAVAACDDRSGTPPESSSRVNAVKGTARSSSVEELCDVRFPDDSAPAFAMPALAGAPPPAAKGWRWVNVWATWCKPCVEEMQRLEGWETRLAAAGHPFSVIFISADEAGDRTRFADPDAVGAWAASAGLEATANVPIHVVVDPADRVRCARVGAVHDGDLAAVEALLR